MKSRVTPEALFVAASLAFFAATHGRALAVVEYCGASASLTPVGVAGADTPTATYAITLWANSSRTVSGHIAVQGESGWYDIAFNGVNLTPRTHRYRGPSVLFSRTDFESPRFFATFPTPIAMRAAFVDAATVTNEHVLGWDSQEHACAGYDIDLEHSPQQAPKDVSVLDPDPSPTPPPPGTPVLHASIASAPGSTNCALPFAGAKATRAMPPDFPIGYHIDQAYVSLIEVAVNEKGRLDDAWVYAPSGIKALDDAAMRSARLSTYDAPRAFCQNVPGVYLFRAVFRPN